MYRPYLRKVSSAPRPASRTIARRAALGDSDNRLPCGCDGSHKHPSRRRVDMRELLRREIVRGRKRAVRLPERISLDAMLLEKRTYNAARGDESSLKSVMLFEQLEKR